MPAAATAWSAPRDGVQELTLDGGWDLRGLRQIPPLQAAPDCRRLTLRGAPGWRLDTAGALVLARALAAWESAGLLVDRSALEPARLRLLDLVERRGLAPGAAPRDPHAGFFGEIGRGAWAVAAAAAGFAGMVGELVWEGAPLLLRPQRVRWREVAAEIDAAGLRAAAIVGLLSFLIGMVMAYQGGATLANYGANILIVNLVGVITLREMGPLLTAILVAGRTGSSYTAQLGTMRITEEIDALRALGLSPFEWLVLPKVLALCLVLPLLSLLADLMGLLGGACVAALGFGVPWQVYFERVPQVVGVHTLLLGLVKAPVFAIVVALVGCMQGLRVSGSAAAVGRATTRSVVQSIFLVIVIDALFSVIYNLLGL
jgi:phospholipid/cholesterol/gamma-HCH transport system permease protein